MKSYRQPALITAVITLLSSLYACGSESASPSAPAETAVQSTETIAEETTANTDEYGRELIPSALDGDLDFSGKTVKIYYRPDVQSAVTAFELLAEEENGDIINDAVYKRNRAVEERLGVTLELINPGTDDNDKYQQNIIKSVKAGDNSFDIAPIHGYHGPNLAIDGYFYNFLKLPYLDLSKPWWNQDLVDQATVYDSIYFITGDLAMTATSLVFATFFDKNNLADYFPELDLYDEVRQGKWTIDRFGELTKSAYSDLNGDGTRDDDDFYACFFPTASTPLDALEEALEVPITKKNADGIPELVYNAPKVAEAYQKLYSLLFENEGINAGYYTFESIEVMRTAFIQGRTIFSLDVLRSTEQMRDMNHDYGVLPIFKWSESQEKYKTTVQDAFSQFAVSAACADIETVSAVLEAMGEYSYQYVTPAYFEIALKRKYARGENDAEMYDLLLDGRCFNFGVVYSKYLGALIQQWRMLLDKRDDTWQSTIDKLMPKSEKSLEKLLASLEELSEQE